MEGKVTVLVSTVEWESASLHNIRFHIQTISRFHIQTYLDFIYKRYLDFVYKQYVV